MKSMINMCRLNSLHMKKPIPHPFLACPFPQRTDQFFLWTNNKFCKIAPELLPSKTGYYFSLLLFCNLISGEMSLHGVKQNNNL